MCKQERKTGRERERPLMHDFIQIRYDQLKISSNKIVVTFLSVLASYDTTVERESENKFSEQCECVQCERENRGRGKANLLSGV